MSACVQHTKRVLSPDNATKLKWQQLWSFYFTPAQKLEKQLVKSLMDSDSKQYWLSQLIITESFKISLLCDEFAALFQTRHVLSTHKVSTIKFRGYICKVNKGKGWWWKCKLVTCHLWTQFWTRNLKLIFSADEKLETWLQLRSMHRKYFSSVESEFHSKCCHHESRQCLCLSHIWTQQVTHNHCIFNVNFLRNKNM